MVRSLLAGLALVVAPSVSAAILVRERQEARDNTTIDPCACMNWKEVFARGLVSCPLLNRFYKESGYGICHDFLTSINDNFCVNSKVGADRGQWCIVDKECDNLNGGGVVNEDLKFKLCKWEQDRRLRELTPPQLLALAVENHWDISILHKMAYPLASPVWNTISRYWNATPDDLTYVPPGLAHFNLTLKGIRAYLWTHWGKPTTPKPNADVLKLITSVKRLNQYVAFDTEVRHHAPQIIVKGYETVYLVLPDLVCITGCDNEIVANRKIADLHGVFINATFNPKDLADKHEGGKP